jgi:ectoine hydroxylase-related dioxygenase (phytanoyl-CoA dioxygenase family)
VSTHDSNPGLHRFNVGFRWAVNEGPFQLISDEQADQYNQRGYFLLEQAFDAALMSQLIAEIDPLEAKTEAYLQSIGGKAFIARSGEITFSTHLVARSALLAEFVRHPVFRGLTHDLLGPDVRLYWDQAVYKKPGTTAPFPWHQDNGYTFIDPQQYLTCWVALSDATLDMGCPWVMPGLHKHGTLAHHTSDLGYVCLEGWPQQAVPVAARAGDIVVFSSLTPHATGANRSTDVRKSYIVQFAPDGACNLTQDEAGAIERVPCNDELRQFPILQAGAPAPA